MFYKKVNYNSNKECFDFLANHFTYSTLNTWNDLKSIANNVKLYNLPVDLNLALEALEKDDYLSINEAIHDWEDEYGLKVAFNGRSGGYLVLYNPKNNTHVFSSNYSSPCFYRPEQYNDWVADIKSEWGSLKNYHAYLVDEVKTVQAFDKLCDDLVEIVKMLIDELVKEKAHTHKWSATKRHEHYVYDTLEDLIYHEEYMLQHGAKVFDKSCDDLYVEYEVCNYVEGEVVSENEN